MADEAAPAAPPDAQPRHPEAPSPDADATAADARRALEAAAKEAEDPGVALEEMRYFTAFYWQEGRGYQSQADPVDGKGREDAWIIQPMMYLRVRQNSQVVHELTLPVDVVSAASTDALDVVSKASEYNEAFSLDWTGTYSPSDVVDMSFQFGFHYEEPLRSLIAGPALTFKLFEQNTIIGVQGTVIADGFDPHTFTGRDKGFAARTSFSFNLTLAQVLSPTTLLDASFGTTEQWGTLETTWNSMLAHRLPTEDSPATIDRTAEAFPRSRNRDALFVRLSQHIPASHTTAKVGYRFYFDENGVLAHTGEVDLYQYLVPWLYVRAHGRLHMQNAISFWMPYIEEPFTERQLRTSDSDLAAFISREAGIKLVFLRDRAPAAIRDKDSFEAGYLHYERTNGLSVDMFSVGYSRFF
ncbi:MAG: DUF3570 domain-containing protein [Polyangiaceae bacterium]